MDHKTISKLILWISCLLLSCASLIAEPASTERKGRSKQTAGPEDFINENSPAITQLHPTDGIPGDTVVIYGTHLDKVKGVRFPGRMAGRFVVVSPGEMNATVPHYRAHPDNFMGPIALQTDKTEVKSRSPFRVWSGQCSDKNITRAFDELLATIPRGEKNLGQCDPLPYDGGKYTSYEQLALIVRQRFGYVQKAPPRITDVLVDDTTPGSNVIIKGDHFVQVTAVLFKNQPAPFTVISAREIRAIVPIGVKIREVVVSTWYGTANSGGSTQISHEPKISSVSPTSGEVGINVVIKGEQLMALTGVTFGGQPAKFTVDKAGQITATVPVTRESDVVIALVTKNGRATAPTRFHIDYTPQISRVSPADTEPGKKVIIEGKNFYEVQAVTFGRMPASISVLSADKISATVPPGADEEVIVTTRYGSARSSVSHTSSIARLVRGRSLRRNPRPSDADTARNAR